MLKEEEAEVGVEVRSAGLEVRKGWDSSSVLSREGRPIGTTAGSAKSEIEIQRQ